MSVRDKYWREASKLVSISRELSDTWIVWLHGADGNGQVQIGSNEDRKRAANMRDLVRSFLAGILRFHDGKEPSGLSHKEMTMMDAQILAMMELHKEGERGIELTPNEFLLDRDYLEKYAERIKAKFEELSARKPQ